MKTLLVSLSFFACIMINATPPSIGGYNVYYGHLHNHTNYSDGGGTPNSAYKYAKNIAKLDFLGLSDHDTEIDSLEWADTKAQADAINQDGVFSTFYGFEWSYYGYYGHVTVVGTPDYTTALTTNTFDKLKNWLSTREGIAFFNHPGRENTNGIEFNHFTGKPSEKFVGMELWNKGEGFSSFYYNDGYTANDNSKGFYEEALGLGWKIGASGAADNHLGTWGTSEDYRMAILSNNLTRTDLWQAMQARRFYSTMDKNLSLSFKINNLEMGSTVIPGTYMVQVQASDEDGEVFTTIKLYDKAHNVIQEWTPNSPIVNVSANLTTAHGDFYYVKVTESDGGEAVSSPIWIEAADTQAPTAFTATKGAVTATSVELLLNATDNSGTVNYTVSYGAGLTVTTTASSATQKSCVITGLTPSTNYTFSVTAKDAANNAAVNNPITVAAKTTSPVQFIVTSSPSVPAPYSVAYLTDGNTATNWKVMSAHASYITFEYASAKIFNKVVLTSTIDDAPSRDPKNWTIKASNDTLAGWTVLDTRTNQTFATRGLAKTYSFTNNTAYKFYRLHITESYYSTSATMLAEVAFSGDTIPPTDTIAPTAFTAIKGAVTATSVEVLLNATDNSGAITYSISYGTIPTIVTVSGVSAIQKSYIITGLTPATAYTFSVTAKDAANNAAANNPIAISATTSTVVDTIAPTAFTAIKGAITATSVEVLLNATDNSGAINYSISYGPVPTTVTVTGVSAIQKSYIITGLTPATAYTFSVTAKDAANNAAVNNPVVVLATTSAVAVPALIVTSSPKVAAPYSLANLTDGNTATNWKVMSAHASYITFEYASVKTFNKVVLTSTIDDAPSRDPKNWTIKASNDTLAGWTVLDTRTNQIFATRGLAKTYSFTNNTAYKFYRIHITESYYSTSATMLAEIAFSGDTIAPDTQAPTAFTAIKGAVTANSVEVLLNATDNSGAITYSISYGTIPTIVTVAGVSATQKSYIVTGLTPATAYTFSVTAKDATNNAAANNPIAILATTSAVADTIAPTAFTATKGAVTASSVEVLLNATDNSGAINYSISYGTVPTVVTVTGVSATQKSYIVTGLTPSTAYTFSVTAKDAANNAAANNPIAVSATTLAVADTIAPTAFTATKGAVTASSVEVLLNATDNSGAITYSISYGTIPTIVTVAGVSATQKSYIVTGLAPATAYTFSVTAKDTANNAAVNNPIAVLATTSSVTDTIAPTAFTAIKGAVTASSVELLLNATDNSGTINYSISYGTVPTVVTVTGVSAIQKSYIVTGLTPATAYTFSVTAKDTANNAAVNNPIAVLATTSSVTDTIAPTAFTATKGAVTATSVEVLLNATDNSGAINYSISYGTIPTIVTVSGVSAIQKSYIITGLTPATAYTFSVTAKDAANNAAANNPIAISATTSAVTDTIAPTAFTATKGAVTANSVELLLNATDNSGAITYTISYGTIPTIVTVSGVSVIQKSYIVTGLTPATPYTFSVTAKDTANNAAANNPIAVLAITSSVTDTIAPTAFTAIKGAVTASSVEVLLNATDNSGTVNYTISYGTVPTVVTVTGVSSIQKSYIVTGLTPATAYTFSVTAKDAANNPAVNNPIAISATTSAVADTIAPTAFTAIKGAVTASSVEVLLNATDNSGAITYSISYGTIPTIVTVTGVSAIQKSFIVTGLTPATPYTFSVTAKDTANNAAANNPIAISATTSAVADTIAPTAFTATKGAVTASSVEVLLNATDNSGAITYSISYGTIPTIVTVSGVSTIQKSYIITGLTPATAYTFSVTAKDAANNAAANNPIAILATTSAVADTIAPTAFTAIKGAVTASSVEVLLNATDNSGAITYSISYGTIPTIVTVAGVSATQKSYIVTGLTPATTYTFSVTAKDTANNTAANNPIAVLATTSAVAPALIVTSSPSVPAPYSVNYLTDGNTATNWKVLSAHASYITFEYSSAKTFNKVVLTSTINDAPSRDPKNWTIKASNDTLVGWTVLDTRTNQTFASRGLAKTYSFTNNTAYKFYRLHITESYYSTTSTMLAEIAFSGDTITAPANAKQVTVNDTASMIVESEKISTVIDKQIIIYSSNKTLFIKNTSDRAGDLYLYDVYGRFILKRPFSGNNTTSISLNLPSGVYIAIGTTLTEKVIKNLILH